MSVIPNHSLLTVASGETIVLRCRRPNATIGWSVNDTTLGSHVFNGLLFNSSSYASLDGSQIYTLMFTANKSYSNISIKCIASFNVVGRKPEETPPIKVIVEGMIVKKKSKTLFLH